MMIRQSVQLLALAVLSASAAPLTACPIKSGLSTYETPIRGPVLAATFEPFTSWLSDQVFRYLSLSAAPVPQGYGDPITFFQTENDQKAGKYVPKEDTVTVKFGEKLGGGSAGEVYDVSDPASAVNVYAIKKHTDKPDDIETERNHLAKIDELYGVVGSKTEAYHTLLKKWPGARLTKTNAYKNAKDKKAFMKKVYDLVFTDMWRYMTEHYIVHNDPGEGNVMFVEKDDELTVAHLVDWDKACILDPDFEFTEAVKEDIYGMVKAHFSIYE